MAIIPFGGAAYSALLTQFTRETSGVRHILLLDPMHQLPPALRGLAGAEVYVAGSESLTAEFLAQVAPDVVLLPLIAQRGDVFDLAGRLLELGYRGAIRAYCAPLPNARLIRDEVRARFPALDFEVIELPAR